MYGSNNKQPTKSINKKRLEIISKYHKLYIFILLLFVMASYKFTEETDKQIQLYCYRTYTTITALFKSIGSWYATYHSIKKRWVMSARTVKKLKDAWVPIFTKIV